MNQKLTKGEAQELLRKYRMGQCTQREIDIINQWYHTLGHMQSDGRSISKQGDLNELRLEMLEGINERIAAAEQETLPAENITRLSGKRRFLSFNTISSGMAAAFLAGVGALIFFYSVHFVSVSESKISFTDNTDSAKLMTVAPDVSSVVYLSDGTVVWLKGQSKIQYPAIFSGQTREVSLVGEAFFDVAPDRDKPFIIRASNFTTRVVGTSFNIKAYEGDESQEVVVVSGRVVVSLNETSSAMAKELVLRPNEKAIYTKRNNSLESVVESAAVPRSLKRDKLDFDEVRLEDIVNVLNANYDVTISLKDNAMKSCIITADLTNESLEVGITILAKAINATYTIEGSEIVLDGTGCEY